MPGRRPYDARRPTVHPLTGEATMLLLKTEL